MSFSTNTDKTKFDLNSYYYNLDFSADDYILNLPKQFNNLVLNYLSKSFYDTAKLQLPEFRLNGHLDYPEAFARMFFPDFPEFVNLTVDGSYDKKNNDCLYAVSSKCRSRWTCRGI